MPGEGEVAVLVDFGGLSSVADREPIRLESDPSEGEPFFGLDPGPAGTPTGREQVGHVDAENGDPNERTGRWCNRKDCGNRALLMKLRPPMNVGLGGCGPMIRTYVALRVRSACGWLSVENRLAPLAEDGIKFLSFNNLFIAAALTQNQVSSRKCWFESDRGHHR